jgi:hypothetical protein
MRFSRLALALAAAFLLVSGAAAAERSSGPALRGPQDLHGFLLRADEPRQETFTRTPSFAWQPVAGAKRYEFQLATSRSFASGALLARKTTNAPVVSLALALPWITGTPYSVYARVRAIATDGNAGPWSPLFGFNVRWSNVPQPLDAPPGLVRWSTVDGATGYQVWFLDPNRIFRTATNVADEREYYTFHQDPTWTGTVHWRVRAIRALYGVDSSNGARNGLPETSFGPWSPVYTATNPAFTHGPLTAVETVSNSVSTASTPAAHELMPAFSYSGDVGADGTSTELYRVYVATDRDCVNVVFRGAVVGGPAYAPRWNGTLALPGDVSAETADRTQYVPAGAEGLTTMADSTAVTANEAEPSGGSDAATITSGEDDSPSNGDTDTPPATTAPAKAAAFPPATLTVDPSNVGPPVDLWDTGWPEGRYYWTVVPVAATVNASLATTLGATAPAGATTISVAAAKQLTVGDVLVVGTGPAQESVTVVSTEGSSVTIAPALANAHGAGDTVKRSGGELTYHDLQLPQDACAAGRVLSFGRTSEPAVAGGGGAPFASGLSPSGRLLSASKARPSFYGSPLVSWQPVLAASAYEVQWSKSPYPFVTKTTPILTYGTSAVLPLKPGKWWYRVRGINLGLPAGARAMAWSKTQALVVTKPTFAVVAR